MSEESLKRAALTVRAHPREREQVGLARDVAAELGDSCFLVVERGIPMWHVIRNLGEADE